MSFVLAFLALASLLAPAAEAKLDCIARQSPGALCTDDSDCAGPDVACGNVWCEIGTGTCAYNAYEETCEGRYVLCGGVDGLCDKRPAEIATELEVEGTCTGWENIECVYRWCLTVGTTTATTQATTAVPVTSTTMTTLATTVGTTTATTGQSRNLISILLNPAISITMGVGDNKKLTALGKYADTPTEMEDITTKVNWSSQDTTKAEFTFPGLIEAKSSGVTQLTATLGTLSASLDLNVIQQQGEVVCDVYQLKMKALVIYDDNTVLSLGAIRSALSYIGLPYDERHVSEVSSITAFTDAACRGNYQALLITDGNLRDVGAGLKDKNGVDHEDYCTMFGVRTVYWYTWPTEYFGFDASNIASSGDDILLSLTAEGRSVFPYMETETIDVRDSWYYRARPLIGGTTPLIVDSSNPQYALALVNVARGREMLTITVASAEYSRHMVILFYGIVNWVTRGLFIGNRRVYMSAHIDDYFVASDTWPPDTPCGTPTWQTGSTYRMDRTDLEAVLAYQDNLQAAPITSNFALDMVFNGQGASGFYTPDTLTPLTKEREHRFKWINHGWEHLNLDHISYFKAKNEIVQNQNMAQELGLTRYKHDNMVTGEVSGLGNKNFLDAAYDHGIRFLVTDTSRPGEDPGNNLGLYNTRKDSIFLIPRRPTNLFYNVARREEWVAEYNCIFNDDFWGYDLSLIEIIDFEADMLLTYLLRGERYPWMFHQANLCAYVAMPENEVLLLLQELLDAAVDKYKSIYNLPIMSPNMDDLGREIISHMEIRTADVSAILAPGIGLKIQATEDTTTPVTGANIPGAENMMYGGQVQAYVDLKANEPLFVEYVV